MSAPFWAVIAALAAPLVVTVYWRWRRRGMRRELTREEKLAAARKAAGELRRSGRRARRGPSRTGDAQVGEHWSSFAGGPPSDAGGGGSY
ncbi:hypothetical protein DLJ46_20360 [Micromonospora globispora]|uniref:Uncharacterized protein n=1 Tax=Micromonospora globispora TaxID=1450148 RepID=A0A317K0C0_9ACTN|nr:hypothetical protein [Micromonospora globispora]PWU45764.1 hypothetical protein DLJ46_20360 [Micromonospora globispora]